MSAQTAMPCAEVMFSMKIHKALTVIFIAVLSVTAALGQPASTAQPLPWTSVMSQGSLQAYVLPYNGMPSDTAVTFPMYNPPLCFVGGIPTHGIIVMISMNSDSSADAFEVTALIETENQERKIYTGSIDRVAGAPYSGGVINAGLLKVTGVYNLTILPYNKKDRVSF